MITNLRSNDDPMIQCYNGIGLAGAAYTEDVQLLFILHGSLIIRCGKEAFEVCEHQLVLLKRNIRIEYTRSGEDGHDLQFLRFRITADLVKEFTRMSALPTVKKEKPASVLVVPGGAGWMPYILSLDPILLDPGIRQPGLVKIKMLELLFHLNRICPTVFEQLLDIRDHYRINITSTVEDNIMNSVSIEELAALSGRSLSSFRRDFMAIYQMPPSEWIRLKRLEKARELLLGTTMTVTEICYTLGFEHIAHFSRLFKSHFGQPPSCYKATIF